VLSTLKGLKDLGEAAPAARDRSVFQEKASEFQSKNYDAMDRAIAAQEERAALLALDFTLIPRARRDGVHLPADRPAEFPRAPAVLLHLISRCG
jgi:hypothetical protein